MTVAFLLTTLVVVATPGTGALYTVATGLAHGSRAAAVAALGCTLGIVPHMLAAVTGLAAVLHSSAVAFQTLKYLGIAFLLYLAWSMWRDDSEFVPVNLPATPPSTWRIVGTAVAVNLLNPKLTLFFFAFLPQFVLPAGGSPVAQMLEPQLSILWCACIVSARGTSDPSERVQLQQLTSLTQPFNRESSLLWPATARAKRT